MGIFQHSFAQIENSFKIVIHLFLEFLYLSVSQLIFRVVKDFLR